ncbi:MAG: MarR family transcriptional regulator [Ardenticatenaceae bacterium]|nr:MarR family transcriptional regulator [Ardenticatenaceae bacterium]
MEQTIFTTMREIFVLLSGEMAVALRPFHLTLEQFDTLLLLQLDSGWRMGDLSGRLLVDNSKMTRIVDYLAEQGWAARQPDPDDRRAQQVVLTSAGAAQRELAQVAHLAALQNSLAGFDEADRTQLLDVLAKWRAMMGGEF